MLQRYAGSDQVKLNKTDVGLYPENNGESLEVLK